MTGTPCQSPNHQPSGHAGGIHHRGEFGYLLYVGIAPREPRPSDSRPSSQTVRKRIRNHFRGNASGSTLRLTLGSLMAVELGVQLRRIGKSERLTFGEGEAVLSEWMAEHARVCWYIDPKPWLIETKLISEYALPLNLDQNRHGSFHHTLSEARQAQRKKRGVSRFWGEPLRTLPSVSTRPDSQAGLSVFLTSFRWGRIIGVPWSMTPTK